LGHRGGISSAVTVKSSKKGSTTTSKQHDVAPTFVPCEAVNYGVCSGKLAQYNEHEATKQLRNMQAMCPRVLQHTFLFIPRSIVICNLSQETRNQLAISDVFWFGSLNGRSHSQDKIQMQVEGHFIFILTTFSKLRKQLNFLCISMKTEFGMWTGAIMSAN
jgi:hypothetical protein